MIAQPETIDTRQVNRQILTRTDEPLLLNARDLAQRLRLGVATIWRMLAAGKLPAPLHPSPRASRWRASEIEMWVECGMPNQHEWACHTSGLPVPCGRGLLGALTYFGLDGLDALEKEVMRELAQRGEPYSPDERRALLNYCQTDVDGLARLFPAMLPHIDLPRAELRGRYMAAVARMEWNGVPVDAEAFNSLRQNWSRIKSRLIVAVDRDYGVFVPTGRAIDPNSPSGAAILAEAREWCLDPYRLAEAVDFLWRVGRPLRSFMMLGAPPAG